MTRPMYAVAIAAALLLTGCGGDTPNSTPTPEPVPTESTTPATEPVDNDTPSEEAPSTLPTWTADAGPSAWICIDNDHGVMYTVLVPPAQDNELVAQIEEAREAAGVEADLTYVPVEIDASEAAEPHVPARGLKWATTEKTTVNAVTISDLTSEWQEGIGIDTNEAIDRYNVLVDLSNELSEIASPARGAIGHQVFATEGPVESMVGLTLTTTWYDELICHLEH